MFSIRIYILVGCLYASSLFAQDSHSYTDTFHYSAVFGHNKYYRLYLPDSYKSSTSKYPVIYFFHGWGGRYFKDDNALLEYEKINLLVNKFQVILVMWDGNIDTTEPRPYNTGNHENVKFPVQMKDYFPELVNHIDSAYRTIANRQHRGIIGFSMGGFMSFYLAGKYPDQVSAAVSFAGSPEFFIGYPGNHTLYPVRYSFKNLQDVRIQLHNGDSDILYYLNDEVRAGARWEGKILDYRKFHGGHMIDRSGETKRFESAMQFIVDAFAENPARAPRWSHNDLYPEFSLWDYTVSTGKKSPGYITLQNVDKSGFGIYSRRWLPDGPPVPVDSIHIVTAPLYGAGKPWRILEYDTRNGQLNERTQAADSNGRLSFFYKRDSIETGIYRKEDSVSFVISRYKTGDDGRFLYNHRTNSLSLNLLNRGGIKNATGKIKLLLTTTDSSVKIMNSHQEISLKPSQRIYSLIPFTITCNKKAPIHAEPPQIKFALSIQSGKQVFTDDIIVPVLYEAPLLDSIRVDDSRGNNNGIAEAGEMVSLFSGSHRLRLYTEDKFVRQDQEQPADEIIPARWPDGYTISSIIKISPDCPGGHILEFYAGYETKTFNPIERKTTWGKVKLTVIHH